MTGLTRKYLWIKMRKKIIALLIIYLVVFLSLFVIVQAAASSLGPTKEGAEPGEGEKEKGEKSTSFWGWVAAIAIGIATLGIGLAVGAGIGGLGGMAAGAGVSYGLGNAARGAVGEALGEDIPDVSVLGGIKAVTGIDIGNEVTRFFGKKAKNVNNGGTGNVVEETQETQAIIWGKENFYEIDIQE
jgi:hypothetical protein